MSKIGFIGAGNMGGALAIAASKTDCTVYVSDPDVAKAAALCQSIGAAQVDNDTVCAECDLIYLGVKPQMLAGVAEQLLPALQARSTPYCLVSMAAGVTLARLGELFPDAAVIRIMPNTPVAVGAGMILYKEGSVKIQCGKAPFQLCHEISLRESGELVERSISDPEGKQLLRVA